MSKNLVQFKKQWGYYEILVESKGYKVKRLTIKPGKSISLQVHAKRSEHWTIASGIGLYDDGNVNSALKLDESIYIRKGERHRIKNTGKKNLIVIEVQIGTYLGEDDIKRYETQTDKL